MQIITTNEQQANKMALLGKLLGATELQRMTEWYDEGLKELEGLVEALRASQEGAVGEYLKARDTKPGRWIQLADSELEAKIDKGRGYKVMIDENKVANLYKKVKLEMSAVNYEKIKKKLEGTPKKVTVTVDTIAVNQYAKENKKYPDNIAEQIVGGGGVKIRKMAKKEIKKPVKSSVTVSPLLGREFKKR